MSQNNSRLQSKGTCFSSYRFSWQERVHPANISHIKLCYYVNANSYGVSHLEHYLEHEALSDLSE